MSTTYAIDIDSFSKKKLLVTLIDQDQYDKWNSLLTKIGGIPNNSDNQPGWLVPKTEIEELERIIEKHGSRKPKQKRKSRQGGRHSQDEYSSHDRSHEDKREHISPHRRHETVFHSKIENNLDERKYPNSDAKVNKEKYFERKETRSDTSTRSDNSSTSDDTPESDSDSDTDDELIQSVLARRLMSESSHKSIDEEDVENSDLEDVVTSMRRFRHIYSEIKKLRSKVADLENQVNKLRI